MADRSTFIIALKAIGFDKVAEGFKKVAAKAKSTFMNLGKVQQNQKKIQSNKIKQLGDRSAKAAIQTKGLSDGLLLMGNNLKGLAIIAARQAVGAFVEMSDQMNRVVGQMELFTGSATRAADLTYRLQEAAVDTGWDLDALSSTVTKLGVGFEQFGHSEEDLIDITKGLGLIFRDMGADGDKLAKVSGNLAQVFTRTTVPFEKLESLLGRGRHEQLFRQLGQEIVKLKGLDLTEFGNQGKNAFAVIEEGLKSTAIAGSDVHQAFVNITKARLSGDIVPTEIGHGWDQVTASIKLAAGQLDNTAGISKSIAGFMHDISQEIKGVVSGLKSGAIETSNMQKFVAATLAPIKFTADAFEAIYDWLFKGTEEMKAWKGFVYVIRDAIKLVVGWFKDIAQYAKEGAIQLSRMFGDSDLLVSAAKKLLDYWRKIVKLFTDYNDLTVSREAKVGSVQAGTNFGSSLQTGAPKTTPTPTPEPEDDGGKTALPKLTSGETALKGLTDQLNNLDAAARAGIITGKEEQELKARLYEQAVQAGAAHGAEIESNDKLLAQLDMVKLHTEGYVGILKKASTETQKTSTATKTQSLTFKMMTQHFVNAGGAALGLIGAMKSIEQGSGGLITKLGQVASAIADAARQAGLSALGPYGQAAGIGLQLIGAFTDRNKAEPAQQEAPMCPQDKATGDPCSQPTTDAAMATTRAVQEQTEEMLSIEQERARGLELQNKLLEDQLKAMPKIRPDVYSIPNAVGGGQTQVIVNIQNNVDPREVVENTMASEAGQQIIRNNMMEDRELSRDIVA